jgi:hypothetical protein
VSEEDMAQLMEWAQLMERPVRRVANDGARPDWTLLAVSELASAAIVVSLRSMFSV